SPDGPALTDGQVIANCLMFAWAGQVTTTHTIGASIVALLQNPDELARLRAAPDRIDIGLEELLRYISPTQVVMRRAAEDIQVGGRTVRAGESVLLVLAAANRDPDQFPDPDRLDVQRAANAHLAFGSGIHHCIGAALDRLT